MAAQHILVPLDFSAHASYALKYAITLAPRLQARLTLLHVIYLPSSGEVNLSSYLRDLEAGARRDLKACLQRVQEAGLAGDDLLLRGVPWQKIVETARTRKADLIVMGTHGRTGLEHILVGSVAERVVRHAPCAVLVTRRRADVSPPRA